MRIFPLIILIMSFALPSYAQDISVLESDSPPPQAQSRGFEDAEDWMLDEAQDFYEQCESDYRFNNYYNCECMAVKYLDKRIEMGSTKPKSSIVLAIRRTCRDATFAAGKFYTGCVASGTILPKGVEMEDYCECFASKYAQLYESSTLSPNSKTSRKLQVRAHSFCRKQARTGKL